MKSRVVRYGGRGCFAAGVALAMLTMGCSRHHHHHSHIDAPPEQMPRVVLPAGFEPLEGHADEGSHDDRYNGWPRHIVSGSDGMIMAYVPTQTLTFGGGPGADEIPSRVITVPHFYMDIHEVTNAQYASYLHCTDRPEYIKYWSKGVNDAHPVRAVSWSDARDYAETMGKSLPTEAQWELAARGSDQRIYPWGDATQVEQKRYLCNHKTGLDDFDGYEFTAPAMNYAAGVSPFGIFNMAGNVAEWCSDWYDPSRYAWPSEEDPPSDLTRGARPFGQRNYPNPGDKTIRESFVGPGIGSQKVVRGGSFKDVIEDCRVDVRMGVRPEVKQHHIGFRCVLTLPPEGAMMASSTNKGWH